MFPFRRPTGSASGLPCLHVPVLALLIAAGVALPSAHATQATQAKARTQPGAAKAGTPSLPAAQPASNLAKSELADIADLRKRMAAKTVVVTRHAEDGDIAIQVWARTTLPKKYYVAVTQQGTVRRTLTANEEADAWRSYDSFRRMAGLGEVGRPVLLGQQMPVTVVSASASATGIATGIATAPLPTTAPLTPPPPRVPVAIAAIGAPDEGAIARAPSTRGDAPTPRSDTPMAAREISATTGESVEPRVAGSAVETLRRARFGDEVARLVWNAESSQYLVSLTRQGSVVAMLRSRDSAEATRAYEDYVRQAETRASLLPGRSAGPVSAASR
ncbi:DUF2968 domain-containing protein [Mitsuaria sp. 7]|uniref:DUF2968 domain-containing protein n=1 Tax=Mitsuaria sp. 7 TaxID=1658665 RepID=UPI0007DDC937|nr:DUF2968 domain-containing protein [Mitsuaria sp. 7]ANH66827.1 hypothetical protein ABE85_03245 [Mitsuaria sp. 7]